MDSKKDAYDFLVGLENELRKQLPAPVAMRALMSRLEEEGKIPSKIRENVFLYYMLPNICEHMQTVPGIGPDEARTSMLCEYHTKVSNIASGNPFRRAGHPFGKNLGRSLDEIMQTWTKPPGALPLNQAYPDFCLRPPFPFKIVFDAKYFFQNTESAAIKALVEGAYEATFYRGLPSAVARDTHEPSWGYDYGCLLAYDASDDGVLESAWGSVRCKDAFWDGANIFVMIIRGTKQA
jgi:hypothetical protein